MYIDMLYDVHAVHHTLQCYSKIYFYKIGLKQFYALEFCRNIYSVVFIWMIDLLQFVQIIQKYFNRSVLMKRTDFPLHKYSKGVSWLVQYNALTF